jgi:hypothetical protein
LQENFNAASIREILFKDGITQNLLRTPPFHGIEKPVASRSMIGLQPNKHGHLQT